MLIDPEILGLIFESLIVLGLGFGCSYFFAAIHLLSMDRKLPVSEFKDRQRSVIFLSMAIFSFGYVAVKYSATENFDEFLNAAPAIGFFAFLGIGFAKFYVSYRERVLEHKEKYEKKQAEKKSKTQATKKDAIDDAVKDLENKPAKKEPLDEPVNFSKMRKSSNSS